MLFISLDHRDHRDHRDKAVWRERTQMQNLKDEFIAAIVLSHQLTHAGSDHMLAFPTGFLSHLCVLCVCVQWQGKSMNQCPALPLSRSGCGAGLCCQRCIASAVLPALYCQRIRTASLLRRRKHVHVFSSLLLSSCLCRRMTEHYATMLLCCACAARQVLHQGVHLVY